MTRTSLLRLLVVLTVPLAAVALVACGGGGGATPSALETPQSSLGPIHLNAHPASLEGKTVVLRWNGKLNGDKLLSRVAELLTQQVKGVKVVKLWETDPGTAISSDNAEASVQIADKIAALAPDLVIASQCD